jgi:probable rRNA maturation factor
MILIEPAMQAKFGRALRRRTLTAFLANAAEAVRLEGQVSVLLAGDRRIRQLNREFRRKDRSTDVLSFPAPQNPGADAVAGDLAISVETAARQAQAFAHPLAVELQILMLHGLLHLAGYDHEMDSGEMARKEAALRRRFGLAAGLIERSGQKTTRPAEPSAASSRGSRKR